MNNIYLIVGKSGSGKSSIVHSLCSEYGYTEVQSYTERQPRYEGETGHIFVTPEQFDELGEMCAYTVFNGNRYGVTSDIIEKSDLYVIDTYGVYYMKEHYTGNKNIYTIGIICDEDETIDEKIRLERMLYRGDTFEHAQERINFDREAFKDFNDCVDTIIVNTNMVKSINSILDIIKDKEKEK